MIQGANPRPRGTQSAIMRLWEPPPREIQPSVLRRRIGTGGRTVQSPDFLMVCCNLLLSQCYQKAIYLTLSVEVLIHALSFLDPHSLLTAALISWRFHSLVTSSHAWRSAFSRYFPSSLAISSSPDARESAAFSSSQDRRYFTRLSGPEKNGNAWRKEYILRTRLLRNLAKGRTNISTNVTTPISHNSHGSVVITYPAATGSWSVSHIAANFAPRGVRLLHASVHTPGAVSASDPTIGKIPFPRFLRLGTVSYGISVKARWKGLP